MAGTNGTTPADNPAKGWFQQIAAWGLANAINSNTALTNAEIAKAGVKVDPIPFGNINLTAAAPATPPAPAGTSPLLATGIGGGLLAAGIGLSKLLSPGPAPAVLPPVAPVVQQAEETIPLIIDWELKNAGQPNAGQRAPGAAPGPADGP